MAQMQIQKEFQFPVNFTHGGARRGAGRPKKSKFQAHLSRKEFQREKPLHITLKLRKDLPSLRTKRLFQAIKRAISLSRRKDLAVVHYSILSNHLHLIVESQDRRRLARQMQSLCVSIAKRFNSLNERSGHVFLERYHVHVLKSPTEVKNAIKYVVLNSFRHRGGKGRLSFDVFSSAITISRHNWRNLLFEDFGKGWTKLLHNNDQWDMDIMRKEAKEILSEPSTWLLKSGWLRAIPQYK